MLEQTGSTVISLSPGFKQCFLPSPNPVAGWWANWKQKGEADSANHACTCREVFGNWTTPPYQKLSNCESHAKLYATIKKRRHKAAADFVEDANLKQLFTLKQTVNDFLTPTMANCLPSSWSNPRANALPRTSMRCLLSKFLSWQKHLPSQTTCRATPAPGQPTLVLAPGDKVVEVIMKSSHYCNETCILAMICPPPKNGIDVHTGWQMSRTHTRNKVFVATIRQASVHAHTNAVANYPARKSQCTTSVWGERRRRLSRQLSLCRGADKS